jgi:hypothetical protein
MVDVASIVISVISFIGALFAAGVTGWFTFFSDERKRLNEAEKLLARYRDPLLLASQDLQSRLYNITDKGITNYFPQGGEEKNNLLLYTAFLVGQYLSWTHILRLQAQFLRFSTDKQNSDLTRVMHGIDFEFSTDKYNRQGAAPLNLWRGQQMAIGELMTTGDGELLCMGYAAFHQKWKDDTGYGTMGGASGMSKITGTSYVPMDGEDGEEEKDNVEEGQDKGKDDWSGEFRLWFRPIIEGVTTIAIAKNERHARIPDQRLRRLQHLLLDLIHILDDKGLRTEATWTSPCHQAAICKCSQCDGKTDCPCNTCKARHGTGHV